MPASWGIIVALSRFGHFNQFYEVDSSPQDIAPATPGFSFHTSIYTSRWLTFAGFEQEGPFMGQNLDPPPPGFLKILQQYDTYQSWPFMDIGNVAFISDSPFNPVALDGLTQAQIGANLANASNPVTRAIVAYANYVTAGVCAADHQRPGSVCRSAGVLQADLKLKIPRPAS